MRQFFTKMLLACLIGSVANLSFSQEGAAPAVTSIVISSGLEGGGYWNAANRLQMGASTVGLAMENKTSTGSVINLRTLLDENSPVSLAFAQADALQYYLNKKPAAAQAIEILEDIGEECVFILADTKSKIRSDKDMQEARQLGLGIRSPNSGIRVTFDYMTSLIPELDYISVHYGDTVDMMENFTTSLTQVKAVMIVHGPNERSPEIDLMLANPDRFHLVKLTDERLTQKPANGEAIYRSVRVAPGALESARPVETVCVKGLLLANSNKLSTEQRSKIGDLVDSHWAEEN